MALTVGVTSGMGVPSTVSSTDTDAVVRAAVAARPAAALPVDGITPAGDSAGDGAAMPVLEVNGGQHDESVDVVVRGGAVNVFLSNGDLVYDVRDGDDGQVVRMRVVGADPDPDPVISGVEPAAVHYFIGSDPSAWVSDTMVAETIDYTNVLPGVHLRYLGTGDGVRYDLLLEPGVDPTDVVLEFEGSAGVSIGAAGQLVVAMEVGDDLVFSSPFTYQDTSNGRVEVESRYRVRPDGAVEFELGEYDPELLLVIDPTLDLATYLGGSGVDLGDAVGVDSAGNLIVAGRTQSADYPTTVGAYDTTKNPAEDIVVSKLSADGSTLLWSTYLGGGANDAPIQLAIDGSDRPVVVGYTASTDFPTVAAYDSTFNGGTDAVVFRLSSNGSALDFSTYMGGVNDDWFTDVAIGPSGSIIIGGYTNSLAFPTTPGAYDTTFGGNDDGVVVRLSSTGSLVYSTFLGGTTRDRIRGVAVSSTGSVHVVGDTQGSLSMPAGGYDTIHNGATDVLYAEISGDGSSLLYATYLGSGPDDYGWDIALASDTDVILVGSTTSSGFPTTAGAYDTTYSWAGDGWVAMIDRTKTGSASLAWSTFYGGTGVDEPRAVAVDPHGRVYVAMATASTGLATADGWDTTRSGTMDAVLGIFSPDGSQLLYATYVGGSDFDEPWSMALDHLNRPVLVGDTASTDFPTSTGAFDRTLGGTYDAFVIRLTALPIPNVAMVNSTGNASDIAPGDGTCSTGVTIPGGAPECTLRAAIQEANASAVVDTIHFDIPTTAAGYSALRGVYTIAATASLPVITAPVTIDGATQAINRGDTNPGTLGYSGPVGTGPDGVVGTGDEPALDGVPKPEVEIVLGGHQGFVVNADSVSISGLAVYGGNRDMAIASGTGAVIEHMVIGTRADSFTDPGLGSRSTGSGGIAVLGGSGAVISGNLIGYQSLRGVEVSGTVSDLTISGNEIRGTAQASIDEGGGIELVNYWGAPGSSLTGATISGNLIAGVVADFNIEVATAAGDSGIVIENNTIHGNQPLLAYGTQNVDGGIIRHNVIADSQGHGIQISDVAGWTISRNSISNSAWPGIALFDANDGLAAPTISAASSFSGATTIDYSVTAPAGSYVVEFFDNTVAHPTGAGEGETYAGSRTIVHVGGTASYTATLALLAGDIVTATLTQDLGGGNLGSTSQFSNAVTVAQAPLEPVVLDRIQKGTSTIAAGSSMTTVAIDTIDPTRSFLMFSVRGNDANPENIVVAGYLPDAASVVLRRSGTVGALTVDWSVLTFASGVTVERGQTTMTATAQQDISIGSIDQTRAFPLVSWYAAGAGFDGGDFVGARLTSSTNLRLSTVDPTTRVVHWQVVTYNDAVVQSGTASLGAAASSTTATVAAVDPSRAWLTYTMTSPTGTQANIGQKLVRGRVTNATTLTFDRSRTGQALDVQWYLVQFTDGTVVQSGNSAFGFATTQNNVTITAVDPARSVGTGGYLGYGGRSSYLSDDNPGVGWFTTRLTSPTNLRATRGVTGSSSADLGWFVITWPGAGPSAVTVNSTDDDGDLFPGDGYCDTGQLNSTGQVECTLRAAIQEANASAVVDTIHFHIPTGDSGHSGGVWTVSPSSAFPTLTQSVTIDATTQPGHTTTPVISINGAGVAGGPGFDVSGDDVTLRGVNVRAVPGDGIYISGARFGLEDSHIGTNAAGTAASANVLSGVLIAGPDATIQGNLVSGNGSNGIRVQGGGDRARIVANRVGTTAAGNAAIPNGEEGVEIEAADDVVVGEPGLGNVISGNNYAGVNGWAGDATGAVIQANLIGLGADGTTPLGNAMAVAEGGITIRGPVHGWLIGGTAPGEGNTIAHNVGDGVSLIDVNGVSYEIAILGNSIHSNTGLGIDIDDDGVTPNDAGDVDTGINGRLNFPVLASVAAPDGDLELLFELDVRAGTYRVEFFSNPSGHDPSGYGEGDVFVHATTVSHAGLGPETYTTTASWSGGDWITATTTEVLGGRYGSTSELSKAACVDSDGDGLCDVFELPYGDTDGDGIPNWLDPDDDGDGIPTALEHADPNGDGDPRDARDSTRNGRPDYLEPSTIPTRGVVVDEQKISSTRGGLIGPLADADRFGMVVASVGDLDGDGIIDLVVGAPLDDDGGTNRGAAYVLFMNADGTVRAEQKVSSTTGGLVGPLRNNDQFGRSVASIGDLDGDGVPDVLVGAQLDDDGGINRGAVYVLFMNADGTVRAEQKISSTRGGLIGPLADGDEFGRSAAGIGDLDGDGIPDVVVGSQLADDGGPDRGAVHVLLLNPDGTVRAEQKISSTHGGLTGPLVDNDQFGGSIAGIGDLDGDGIPDLVIGSQLDDDGGTNRGAVYVLFMNADGTVRAEQKISSTRGGLTGPLVNNVQFGRSVAGAGDLDGDGIPDIAVGTPFDDGGGSNRGAVYVLNLARDGTVRGERKISSTRGGLIGPLADNDQFGIAIAGLGDLDGDGTVGLAVGAFLDDDGGTDRGAVYVLDLAGPPVPTVVVNSTRDVTDHDPGDGVCQTGSLNSAGERECTLRAAIEEANASGVVDTIEFAIPESDPNHSGGVWTITPGSVLPTISAPVTINGASQPGATPSAATFPNPVDSSLAIEVSGVSTGTHVLELDSGASGSTVRGLALVDMVGGIYIVDSSNNTVVGNHLGVSASGSVVKGGTNGVFVFGTSSGNRIGGPAAADRNLFAGNTYAAVAITDPTTIGTVVQGNDFGFTSGGGHVPPVAAFGIVLWNGTSGHLIGGTGPGEGNRIRGAWKGVLIDDNVGDSYATILGNHISGNSAMGIDLRNDGPTINDPLDADSGPNDLLNHPVITSAVASGGGVDVTFNLDVPAGSYRVELFTNPSGASSSGYGEGEIFVDAVTVDHPGGGTDVFSVRVAGGSGDLLTATATEALGPGAFGPTSEFSPGFVVTARSTVRDLSSRRSDLIPAGGASASGGSGVVGPGISVAGGLERLVGPATDISSGALTLSAWVQLDASSTVPRVISKRARSGAIYELLVDDATGAARAVLLIGGDQVVVQGGSLTLGTWHQVVATWDGTNVRLYVDGTEVDQTNAAGALGDDFAAPLVVGNTADAAYGLVGSIDVVQVSRTAWSAAWIETAYSNVADPTAFVSVGEVQTAAPGSWDVSSAVTRTGPWSMAAPEAAGGAEAWATVIGLDEPGLAFESWWYVTDPPSAQVAAGTNAGATPIEQRELGAIGGAIDLATRVVGGRTVDASSPVTVPTAAWTRVEIRTDELGRSAAWIDGVEVIGPTLHTGGTSAGTAGLRAALVAAAGWYVDDVRIRRYVSAEPTTSLGPLHRD